MYLSPHISNLHCPNRTSVSFFELLTIVFDALTHGSLAHSNVSALGAVMAFLYSTYIVINAVLSVVLGRVFDNDFTKNGNIRFGLKMVGG